MSTDAGGRFLGNFSFALLCLVLLVAPWCFGAWEAWWFWPLTGILFTAGLLFGLRLLAEACFSESRDRESRGHGVPRRWANLAPFACFTPFLAYLFIRFLQTDVRMDAERVLLLPLTAFLIAGTLVFGVPRRYLRVLHILILTDLCLIGLYGLYNHAATGSRTVLGVPGYPQYYNDNRASGTYFCPDHFSGLMELAICLSLPWLGARSVPWSRRLLAVPAFAIALTGIYLSKSRGGGLTLAVIFGAWWLWGFLQYPPRTRWLWRLALAGAALLLLGSLCSFGRAYTARFVSYFGWAERDGSLQRNGSLQEVLMAHDRPQMMASALRAWRDAPWLGIGPGMHQNYWPHYAATPDGDRATGRWPRFPNYQYHSDYVHNDRLQLGEELGAVGLSLFLIPAGLVLIQWLKRLYAAGREQPVERRHRSARERYPLICGAVLACAAMGFHSLGDFNLQIPATAWLFSAILAIAWAHTESAGRETPPGQEDPGAPPERAG